MRQFGWPFAAQLLLSTGQLVLTVVGATLLAPDRWGALALALSVHYVAIGTIAGVTQPVLTWFAGDVDGARTHRRAGTWLQVAVGLPAAGTVAVVGQSLGLGAAAWAMGATTVVACAANAARTVALAAGRFRRAAAADAVHLAGLGLGALATGAWVPSGPARSVAVTSTLLVATVAAATVLLADRATGPAVSVRSFVRSVGRDSPWMALDGFLVGCTTAAVVAVVGATDGLADAGAVRTSTTLFAGPLQMLLVATAPLLVARFRRDADLARVRARSGGVRERRPASLAVLAVATAVAVSAALALALALAVLVPFLSAPGALLHDVRTTPAPAVLALAAGLWIGSTTTAYMRYRRSWGELMAVRVLTVAASLGAVVAVLAVAHAPVADGVLAAAGPWLLVPLAHAVLRWGPPTAASGRRA